MTTPARLVRLHLVLVAMAFGAFETQAATIEQAATFSYLNFYGDGACPHVDSVCGLSFDIEYVLDFPRFDESLGELEFISIDILFLFNIQVDYNVIESTAEFPPFVSGAHNGASSFREATECVGLSVGSKCHVDYGDFSQLLPDDYHTPDEYSYQTGPTWRDSGFRGGFGTLWHVGEDGDSLDMAFLEGTSGTVTYSYTPVPEPSTALLLGIGLVGFATQRRR